MLIFVGLNCGLSALVAAYPKIGHNASGSDGPNDHVFKELAIRLDDLRQQLRIPGLAAGVVKDQKLIWAEGFGYADLENKVKASAVTPWHIASVTKTFAAVVLLQLVEEGKLGLDDPLKKFGIQMKSKGVVTVRHILTHTSERTPGTFFRYSGRLWEHLAQVIGKASGKSFKQNLVERIIKPLELTDTAPNKESESESYAFEEVRSRAAVPYRMDESFHPRRFEYGLGFYAAGGLFSSVRDMAKVDAALDNNLLLEPGTRTAMFTPFASANGRFFPHGLGWFCQDFQGTRLVWHFGWHPDHASSLLVKVPDRNLTFMIFANTDKLSQPFNLLRGNILNSPAALLFLKAAVFPGEDLAEIAVRETETNDIILKTSGRKPLTNAVQKGVLIGCLLIFLSAPILWAADWVRGKQRVRLLTQKKHVTGWGLYLSRAYALLTLLLCVLFYGALIRAPFLAYWPEFPGWIDGISVVENVFLALPTLLALMGCGLIILTVWIWIRNSWTHIARLHYSLVAASVIGYVWLLGHWHLIGFSYYWNYLIR